MKRITGAVLTAALLAAATPVAAFEGDAEMIAKASVMDDDPQDGKTVLKVCTVCHSATQYLHGRRTFTGWQTIFGIMSGNGARGTDEDWGRIVRYFQRNLTVVNPNTTPPDELGATLQVDDSVIAALEARDKIRPFKDIQDLATIPGLDLAKLKKLQDNAQLRFTDAD